jgi:uncharacterized Tic20 family protein
MNNEISPTVPTQNDRIMAALAHVTAILPMMGIIAPIVIWATQKEKSEYVAFQALQAIVFQLTMVLAWFAGMALYMGSFFATFLGMAFAGSSKSIPIFFFVPFAVMGCMMLGTLVFIVYGLIGAAMVLQGKDFRYIVIGDQLKKYLKQK